ncbi:MAG: hypothetical protein ACPL0A_00030 [Candidatus Micrarchaeia archaeon]
MLGNMVIKMFSQTKNKCMKGQALSYDALGGIVIFLIALGILATYWSSINASFSEEDVVFVREANTALDRIMSPEVMLNRSDMYSINSTALSGCTIDRDYVGLVHNYTLEIVDGSGVKWSCGDNPQGTPSKMAVSERLAYYENEPITVRLKVFVE